MRLACRSTISCALLASVCLLGLARNARAEAGLHGERRDLARQLAEEKQRLRETEQRIRRLEAELARERHSTRVVEQQPEPTNCTLPFFLDASGLKHLRTECMGDPSEAPLISCAAPFEFREDGLKRVRPECYSDAAAVSSNSLH